MMINNVLNNLPANWALQIFYTGEGQSLLGITRNTGLQRLVDKGIVKLVVIPRNILKKYKMRKIYMMLDPWIWENIPTNKVLIFGGNSVLCSNSPYNISYFSSYDYIGTPWSDFKGLGGSGEISIRSKSLMLNIIKSEYNKLSDIEKSTEYWLKWGREDSFFVSRIKRLLENGNINNIKVASKDATLRYGASYDRFNHTVLAVSGTLPGLSFEDRDLFLTFCPELKMIFPSLHDPNCFGAKPDGEKCALTLCALHPKPGGC